MSDRVSRRRGASAGKRGRAMMPARVVLIGVAVLLIGSSHASAAWSPPTNLGPVVNSAVNDLTPAVSKNGLSLFFQSNRPGGFGGNDLWVSQRADKDGPWGAPTNLGATINTAAQDGAPALSRDGHWMFLNSDRPGGFGLLDVWAAYRRHTHDDFDWQAPVNLGPAVNTAFGDQGSSYFENSDGGSPLLFFGSDRPGGLGGLDVYVSAQLADGSWGPAGLVTELSSPSPDGRPVIRFDGREIFLYSSRPGGFGGFDMWVSMRDSVSDPWTPPVNLGPAVNTATADFHPYIASDCKTLYFTRGVPPNFELFVTTREKSDAPCGGR